MKKLSLLAAAGLCSLMFAACSDSGSSADPVIPKGTQCANGITTACATGTWSFIGLENADGLMREGFDYTVNPAKLTFLSDGTFSFENAPSTTVLGACLLSDSDGVMYGTWEVVEGVLNMKPNSTCVKSSNTPFTPDIKVEGGQVKMKLGYGNLLFTYSEGLEMTIRANYSETFTISAN